MEGSASGTQCFRYPCRDIPCFLAYSSVTLGRNPVAKLKSIIQEKDPGAFVAIEHVPDVIGGRFEKRRIH